MVEIAYTNSTRNQLGPCRVPSPSVRTSPRVLSLFLGCLLGGNGRTRRLRQHDHQSHLMAMVFVAMFLLYAVRAVPYSRVWKWSAEQINRGAAIKQIRLRLNEEGLHETVDGLVESFAPWNAIRSFAVVDEHLLIELAGDLWANVPRTTIVEGSAAFDQLVQTLRSHGIAEKTR